MSLRDISVPIRNPMPIWAGNPGVHTELAQAIARGDHANVTRLDFGAHTGTHVDAPFHFYDDGTTAESIDPQALIGEAWVVDATAATTVLDAAAIAAAAFPPGAQRVLLKTRNSELWASDEFTRDHVRLDAGGAQAVLDAGPRLIGIDYLSIGDGDAHRLLLGAGVVPLEGLDLRGVEPGRYTLYCTALRVVGSDGAPARALLGPPPPAGAGRSG